jgi:signal peptidase I
MGDEIFLARDLSVSRHRLSNGLFSIAIILALFLLSFQVVLATSIRICSSIERDQVAANDFDEIWKVSSESMYPLLTQGDLVIVEDVTFTDIQPGDIILFKEPVPDSEVGDYIISRVNDRLTDPEDQLVLVTKGDANSGSIPGIDFPVYEKDFIGIVDCFLEEGEYKK